MALTTINSGRVQPALRSYIVMGLWSAALATVVNLTIYVLGTMLFNLPFSIALQPGAELTRLPAFMVVLMSAVPALLAVLVLYALERFTRHGLTIFAVVSAVLVLLSLAGPLTMPIDGGTKAALVSMHLAAAASIVGLLAFLSSRRRV